MQLTLARQKTNELVEKGFALLYPIKFYRTAYPLKDEEEVETEIVRARNKKGRYMADDPSTPNVNEAYTTIKVKKKKKK